MSEVVVAANRGPFSLERSAKGDLVFRQGGGGLAPSLAAALSAGETEATWVATAMSETERAAARAGVLETGSEGLSLVLLDVDEATYSAAYDVVANQTLWFLLHGLFDTARRPIFDRRWREAWEAYRAYNAAFADAISEAADDKARVLVNDYHLFLVGGLLAERRDDLRTVHFTHTPFPCRTELEILPRDVRRELVEALSGFGACGFHTRRWEERYRRAADALALEASSFAAPLGPDAARLREVATSSECTQALSRLEERIGGRTMIFRSDRVELSKNILRGFLAFDALLEEKPALRGEVCFVARAYASRAGLAEYLAYRSQAEHLAALLNEKWSPLCGEAPILFDVDDDFPSTAAAFRRYDVLLVNPVRDGMNLVAKEGPVLNEHDGLLVLSEEAGAWEELGDVALGVQPFDVVDTAAALARALEMPAAERRRRSTELKSRAESGSPAVWFDDVLGHARSLSER